MNTKLFSEAITEVDNKYYEEAATYDYRVDNEVDTYSRAFALRRKLKTVLIAAVIMALAFHHQQDTGGEGAQQPVSAPRLL